MFECCKILVPLRRQLLLILQSRACRHDRQYQEIGDYVFHDVDPTRSSFCPCTRSLSALWCQDLVCTVDNLAGVLVMRGLAWLLSSCTQIAFVRMMSSSCLLNPGHQTEFLARSRHFTIPWCPAWILSSILKRMQDGITILEFFSSKPIQSIPLWSSSKIVLIQGSGWCSPAIHLDSMTWPVEVLDLFQAVFWFPAVFFLSVAGRVSRMRFT